MDRTEIIAVLEKVKACIQSDYTSCHMCCDICKFEIEDEKYIETLGAAIEELKKAPTALDHIHNVVSEREYQRGYEQGKADANHPEIPDGWIPVSKEMPKKEDCPMDCLVT